MNRLLNCIGVLFLFLGNAAAENFTASIVKVDTDAKSNRVFRVDNSAQVPPLILDRFKGISVGFVNTNAVQPVRLLSHAAASQESPTRRFMAITSNRAPKLQAPDLPTGIKASSILDLYVTAEDPEGDRLSYTWTVSAGHLMLNRTQTGWNRFMAPRIDGKQDSMEIKLSVEARDSFGGRATVDFVLQVSRPDQPPSFEEAITLNPEDDLFDGNRIISAVIHGDMIHCVSSRGSYYTFDPASHTAQRIQGWKLRQILSDGLAVYGVTHMNQLACIGRPSQNAYLPFSALKIRKKTGSVTARLQPPNTVYEVDSYNQVLDLYQLEGKEMISREARFFDPDLGTPVSGDWAYDRIWCTLFSNGKLSINDLMSGMSRELKTGFGSDAYLDELAAGEDGRLVLRNETGTMLYFGSLYDEGPFEAVDTPIQGLDFTFHSLHWNGGGIVLGTEPAGIAFYDPDSGQLQRAGHRLAEHLRHITFLPDGQLAAYDSDQHALFIYDRWGFENGLYPLDTSMRIDDLDSGPDGRLAALDERGGTVYTLSLDNDQALCQPLDLGEMSAQAVSISSDRLHLMITDTQDIPFSGERMMMMSFLINTPSDRKPLQVPQWKSTRKAKPEDISLDMGEQFLAGCSDKDEMLMIAERKKDTSREMRFYSYESLGIGRIANIEVNDDTICILDTYPTTEVVMVNARTGQAYDRWSTGLGQESTMAVTDGQVAVLDRKKQTLVWYRIRVAAGER